MRFLTLILMVLFTNSTFAMDVKNVFDFTRPSVVLIVAYDQNEQPLSMGSGFYFGDKNTIATNLHVIQNASKLAIKLSNGKTDFVDTVSGIDPIRDLAILKTKVDGKPLSLSERLPEIGEDIIAIGNPSGLEGTVSTGIISGIRTDADSQYFQITAPISPGSSGGPIISANKEVLGVSTFYLDGAQSLNFAMPSAYLKKLYNNQSVKTLAALSISPKKQMSRVEENVVILSPGFGNCYTSGRCDLEFSIGNRSKYEISDVKLLVKFYNNLDDELPLHFMLTKVSEKIPSKLSKRIKRKTIAERNWKIDFTIMDYTINKSSDSGTLLNFDQQ